MFYINSTYSWHIDSSHQDKSKKKKRKKKEWINRKKQTDTYFLHPNHTKNKELAKLNKFFLLKLKTFQTNITFVYLFRFSHFQDIELFCVEGNKNEKLAMCSWWWNHWKSDNIIHLKWVKLEKKKTKLIIEFNKRNIKALVSPSSFDMAQRVPCGNLRNRSYTRSFKLDLLLFSLIL